MCVSFESSGEVQHWLRLNLGWTAVLSGDKDKGRRVPPRKVMRSGGLSGALEQEKVLDTQKGFGWPAVDGWKP